MNKPFLIWIPSFVRSYGFYQIIIPGISRNLNEIQILLLIMDGQINWFFISAYKIQLKWKWHWMAFKVHRCISGENQYSSAITTEMNFPQFRQQSANFIPQSHSTPIFHPHNIPPLFESPESASSNQSLSHSLSLSTISSSAAAAKGSDESLDKSNATVEFICITCEGSCHCNKE